MFFVAIDDAAIVVGYSILSRSRRTHTGRGYGQLLDELDVLVEHGHVVEARPPHFYPDQVVGRVDAWEERESREDEQLHGRGTFIRTEGGDAPGNEKTGAQRRERHGQAARARRQAPPLRRRPPAGRVAEAAEFLTGRFRRARGGHLHVPRFVLDGIHRAALASSGHSAFRASISSCADRAGTPSEQAVVSKHW